MCERSCSIAETRRRKGVHTGQQPTTLTTTTTKEWPQRRLPPSMRTKTTIQAPTTPPPCRPTLPLPAPNRHRQCPSRRDASSVPPPSPAPTLLSTPTPTPTSAPSLFPPRPQRPPLAAHRLAWRSSSHTRHGVKLPLRRTCRRSPCASRGCSYLLRGEISQPVRLSSSLSVSVFG